MAKVLVSFNERLLKQIDRVATSRGMSRSAYLAELAEHDLTRAEGPGKKAEVRRALKRLDKLFSENPIDNSTTAIRAERDMR